MIEMAAVVAGARPFASALGRSLARDLHLVLGPGRDGRPVPFRVTIDGHAPGDLHGDAGAAAGRVRAIGALYTGQHTIGLGTNI
ncbi:MAG: hypothetical protein ACRYHA_27530 [Janthinobacterium lividum]